MSELNNLVACPKCIKVLKYYDYLSHAELCKVSNNENNENNLDYDMETNFDENEENDNTNFYYNINTNYNTYSRMVGENLYNSNLDRQLHNALTIDNINTNTNINDISDNIGLGFENLSLYSTKIPITNQSYCVICMNTNITSEDNTFYLMKCMHSFCNNCSKKWFDFKPTCPLCKTNMRKI